MPLPSKIRGIRKRWMLNSISVVLLVVLVAVSAFSIAMSSYYYASLSTGLTNTAKTVAGFFENYTESEYRANMTRQIASFEEKDRLDLQFLSRYGRIQESTSGLTANTSPGTQDITDAITTHFQNIAGRYQGLSSKTRQTLKDSAQTIAARLRETPELGQIPAPEFPGNRPYRKFDGVPMKPKAGSACIRCGRCAAGCPVGAIPTADPTQTDNARCITCMQCVHNCPVGARQLNKLLFAAAEAGFVAKNSARKEPQLFLA